MLRSAEQVMIDARQLNGGFLNETEVQVIAGDSTARLTMLLVRCGAGRFIAPAQDVAHFVAAIEKSGDDYVRDVSLYTR